MAHDWINQGLSTSSRVCATGHIKDPVPLIEKSRAVSRFWFSSSFIHQVITITGLNNRGRGVGRAELLGVGGGGSKQPLATPIVKNWGGGVKGGLGNLETPLATPLNKL